MAKDVTTAGSPGYWGFMENTAGLGSTGTHIAHGSVAGAGTWAAGQYGGVEMISDRWWAPFAGGLAGLGLSIAAKYLMVDDNVKVAILEQKIRKDLASVTLTPAQARRLKAVMRELTALEDAHEEEEEEESPKAKARKKAGR
jgi:hypothetical protein